MTWCSSTTACRLRAADVRDRPPRNHSRRRYTPGNLRRSEWRSAIRPRRSVCLQLWLRRAAQHSDECRRRCVLPALGRPATTQLNASQAVARRIGSLASILRRDGLLTFNARPMTASWSFDGAPVSDGRRIWVAMRRATSRRTLMSPATMQRAAPSSGEHRSAQPIRRRPAAATKSLTIC